MNVLSEKSPGNVLAALGALGVVTYGLALSAAQPVQFNVVSYRTVPFQQAQYWPSLIFVVLVFATIIALCGWTARTSTAKGRWLLAASLLWPLLLSAPFACYAFSHKVPPFALSLLMILAAGWAAYRVATRASARPAYPWAHPLAVGSLVLLIAVLTIVHTRTQINFFEHFMLGHADFGHFTEELKNALAGRGLRSDSFENTRLGWHFVPLLYVLVPGYALWSSPAYLMVCSALFVHVVALPVYYLARRLSGSAAIGFMWAAAWLLLPSQSRLVYSNTYGFQWIYVAMPLLAVMIASGVTGRWRTCLVMVALVLLCKETAAAATFGWGLYVTLFTPRRKMGIAIAVGSVVYFILCTKVIIPHFAVAERYERLNLFGELGTTSGDLLSAVFTQPEVFFGRLLRREALYFLLMLIVPMALLPLRGWRIALAALPTLALVLLLQNTDWLSIKFWHQCTVLPFLFFAGIALMQASRGLQPARVSDDSSRGLQPARMSHDSSRGRSAPSRNAINYGIAAAVLVCAALGHYFYGFSPISKAYEVYATTTWLHEPDPRLETVRRLRTDIPVDCTILTTERLAAHFTDYQRLYTGYRIRPADFVIIDRSDRWDTSGMPHRISQFARDPDYSLYGEFGSIVVFARRPDAPPATLE
ncbi:MAG: DUF2079 domain-containing protein [Phycisphaerae bacterium]